MKPTVLFVDDDTFILSGFIRSFHKEAFQVFTAHSAEEAMDILKRTDINVIVSDEKMGGMDGTDLLCWVVNNFPHIPRIILSGRPDVPTMQRAINDAKVYRYLTKPANCEYLANTIRQAIAESDKPVEQA